MLRDDGRTLFNLVDLNHAGISIAEYPQIKEAVVERLKQIYGSDIDLSTANADGVYVETFSLVINNVLQTLKQLYGELDIRTATGIFLDALCALSGVYRKSTTHSSAILLIKLVDQNSSATYELNPTNGLTFADKNGTTWVTQVPLGQTITLRANIETAVTVICSEPGPIAAIPNWIDKLINTEIVVEVRQLDDAEIGSRNESDAQLRSRRNKSMSTKGISVLETLAGALLSITGIEDLRIYNNDTVDDINANDGALIKPHQLYVVIRRNKNIAIADSVIGSLIYEKLTPGIGTASTGFQPTTGELHTYKYSQFVLGVSYENPSLLQNIHWKEATPIKQNTLLELKLTKQISYATTDDHTAQLILAQIKQYLDGLEIGAEFSSIDLINQVNDVAPMFKGKPMYVCTYAKFTESVATQLRVTGSGDIQTYQAKDTYFDFANAEIVLNTVSGLTISLGIGVA